MKRSIILILYFIGYQLLFGALAIGLGYVLPEYTFTITLLAQVLATLAIAVHLILAHDNLLPLSTFNFTETPNVRQSQASLLLHSLNRSFQLSTISIILIVSMGCWTNYIVEILQLPDINEEIIDEMMRHPLGILSIALLAPITEELLFRGAIQPRLIQRFNPAIGIIITSLVFGIIHGNPIQIPFAFLTGLALGWVAWRTGSLLFPILMHFVNNASSVYLYYAVPDEADSTLVDMLGATGAATIALCGAAVTALCIYLINKQCKSVY